MHTLPIKGYQGLYFISCDGTVLSAKGHKLYLDLNKTGYYQVSLWKNNYKRTFYVHRLVAQAFIENKENKPEVNHIDGDKLNNSYNNLEWMTSSENSQHAVDTGLRTYSNKLSREEFVTCLHQVLSGYSYAAIAESTPYKVPFLSNKLRKLAKELGLEQALDHSLANQRVMRARANGLKNK